MTRPPPCGPGLHLRWNSTLVARRLALVAARGRLGRQVPPKRPLVVMRASRPVAREPPLGLRGCLSARSLSPRAPRMSCLGRSPRLASVPKCPPRFVVAASSLFAAQRRRSPEPPGSIRAGTNLTIAFSFAGRFTRKRPSCISETREHAHSVYPLPTGVCVAPFCYGGATAVSRSALGRPRGHLPNSPKSHSSKKTTTRAVPRNNARARRCRRNSTAAPSSMKKRPSWVGWNTPWRVI